MVKTMNDTMKDLGIKVCPICGKEYTEHPAISRKDDKTEICPRCGIHEGLESYLNSKLEGKENDSRYCIFEKRICRYARKEGSTFRCAAPSDNSLKFICK